MKRSQSIIWGAALGLALWSGLPAAGGAADVPVVTTLGSVSAGLRAPGQMALDSRRVLYVADTQKRGIVKFDTGGSAIGLIPISGVVRSVACTPDDRLIVSHDGSVHFYSSSGTMLAPLVGYGFVNPNGIAVHPDGTIYVADSKRNQVAVFNSAGAFVSAFGGKGSGAGEFNFPTDLAWESASQQLAVADTLNNRVQFFDAAGAFKRVIGAPSNLAGPLKFTYPQGVSFDYVNGVRMYVADAFQSSVQVIELGALPRFLSYIGSYGAGSGELQRPSDVIFDAAVNELLVADSAGRINIYGIQAPAGGSGTSEPTESTGATGSTGSTGSGTGSSGSGTVTPGTAGSSGGSWQYPAGTDCRHARAGSIVCK